MIVGEVTDRRWSKMLSEIRRLADELIRQAFFLRDCIK
jgi:hypothetical protein